jgi:hypothetical protein
MRKLLVAVAFAMLCHISVKSQLVTYSFTGTGTCPTQGNSSISFANGSASALARVGTLTCQTATNGFNSSGWSQSATIDNSQYLEVTITANPGYKLDLTSLSFSYLKSSTGASSIQVIHNGTGAFNTASSVYTVSTTEATSVFDFTDFSSSPNGTISFRIYGWGASSSTGTTRITGLQINGAVTSSTVFVYDYSNERVGLGTTTLNSKFQVNETSIATPNNLLFSRTLPTTVNNNANYSNLSINSYLNSNFSSTPNTGLTGIFNYYQGNTSGTNTNQFNKVIYNQYKSTVGSGTMSYLTVNDNVFEYANSASTNHSNISLINAGTAIYGGSGNITNLTYLRATPGISSGASNYTGTITNQYGLYLGNIIGATNNYAIYSAGGKSYFADNVGIGTSSPAQKLDVLGKLRLSSNVGSEIEFYDTNRVANGPAVISKILGGNMVNHGSGFLGFNTTLNGNITEKMRVDCYGNVGIGTTSPNTKLHIYQTTNLDLAKFETYWSGGRNILKISAGGSLTHTYDSSLRYMLTSNGTIDKGLPAGYDNGLLALSPTSYISGGGSGIGRLEFFTNNSSRLKITENGQIGIGTTNPTSRLHVNGDIKFESFKNTALKDSILTTDSLGNLQFVKMPIAQLTDSSKWAYLGNNIYNKNGGNVGIGTTNPTSKFQVNGSVRFDTYRNNAVGDSVLTTDSLGNLRLTRIATNTVTDSSKWAYSGNNIYNKNFGFVGIGVVNPTAKLHTSGSVRLESYGNNNTEDSVLVTDINGNLKLKSLSTFSNINLNASFTATNGLTKLGNTVALGDSLRRTTEINLNGYDFSFGGNGNIGFGTPNPTAQLHLTKGLRLEQFRNTFSQDSVLTTDINGNVVFRYIPLVANNNSTGTYQFINGLTNYNDSVFLGGKLNDNVSFNLDSIYDFSINSGRNKVLNANHNGNIGIGTIAPNFKVDILGNLNLGFDNSSTSGYSSKLYFGANAATDALWLAKFAGANSEAHLRVNLGSAASNNKFSIGNASGSSWKSAFEVNANGNVSIGTTQSTSLFSVDSTHGVKLSIGNLNWSKTAILTTTSLDGIDYTDITVPSLSSNNARLRLSSTGGIGIGVDVIDTAYSLMVKGKIKSKGLKVQTSGWADYVFNNNYKLNSLEYLEAYVNKNKHLPEIPTANEVIRDGVDVGDMQVKLLKKVEELTLYIIEQNKRINELEKNNKVLKQQNTNVDVLSQQIADLKALILSKSK